MKQCRQTVSPLHNSRTPQGVRGLKLSVVWFIVSGFVSHSARSAWIETVGNDQNTEIGMVALRKECVD